MKILVFTSIYPIEGTKKGMTPVVKYFCEDWVKLGHEVVVISSPTKFPYIFYYVPEFLSSMIENSVGFVIPNKISRNKIQTEENGVKIYQLPISKTLPGQNLSELSVSKNMKLILKYFKKIHFTPEVAVGHWVNPQIQYLSNIKKRFKIPTSLIIHGDNYAPEIELFNKYLNDIDNIGFRSEKLIAPFMKNIKNEKINKFYCHSGVTDHSNLSKQKYLIKRIDRTNLKIFFVGTLIARKYPETILKAVNQIANINFEIHYIGDGKMKDVIEKIPLNNNVNVFLHGRRSREEVYKLIQKADIFVMLSRNETFGLVYLEAMLNRVIPIASYNEGFDGIIKNKVNGFLGRAGNEHDLEHIILDILNMSENELYSIQRNSFETAVNMTDMKMALRYLSNISKVSNNE